LVDVDDEGRIKGIQSKQEESRWPEFLGYRKQVPPANKQASPDSQQACTPANNQGNQPASQP